MKKVVTLLIVTTVALLYGMFSATAQTRSTMEAKVILIVNVKSKTIDHMELLNTFQKRTQQEILKDYPYSKFYYGLLSGSYELTKNIIIPLKDATVTMYSDQQFYVEKELFSGQNYSAGNEIYLGEVKAKIVSKNKGELIFKTQ